MCIFYGVYCKQTLQPITHSTQSWHYWPIQSSVSCSHLEFSRLGYVLHSLERLVLLQRQENNSIASYFHHSILYRRQAITEPMTTHSTDAYASPCNCINDLTSQCKLFALKLNSGGWNSPQGRKTLAYFTSSGAETNILGKIGQYHGCWCPCSLCHSVISNHWLAFYRCHFKMQFLKEYFRHHWFREWLLTEQVISHYLRWW